MVVRETRLWDGDAGTSHSMRRKEEADDYRYMPDPDLPPLVVTAALLDEERAALPELPAARYARYVGALGLAEDAARTLCSERALGDYFDAAIAGQPAARGRSRRGSPHAGARRAGRAAQRAVAADHRRADQRRAPPRPSWRR
jgi:Asp-tRNA(Asn)/Glu-tRNA(Gln) amidotransferase B subunit